MNKDINTEVLTKSLNEFAKANKLNEDQYKQLKGRKKTIVNFIEEYSKYKDLSIAQKFNVGSYKIRTGVQRTDGTNGWAFDIDYVIAYTKEFDFENFKNNLTAWIRKEVKDKYKRNVIVSNKKKVISIAFRDQEDEKTEFYLDVALYVKKNGDLYHIKRNVQGNYDLQKGEPKVTYTRQKEALSQNEDKRNAIILLKYLKEKGRIKGASSIFITDKVISYPDLDTFSLMKKFIEENKDTITFTLKELPNSELIKDFEKLNDSLEEMNDKFFSKNTVTEVYAAMNSWFDYKLPELDKELMEDRNERYSGG